MSESITIIWSIWDRKAGTPTIFSDKNDAIGYARLWLKNALSKKDFLLVQEIERNNDNVEFFVENLNLLSVRKTELYHNVDSAPHRKDYPRPRPGYY